MGPQQGTTAMPAGDLWAQGVRQPGRGLCAHQGVCVSSGAKDGQQDPELHGVEMDAPRAEEGIAQGHVVGPVTVHHGCHVRGG